MDDAERVRDLNRAVNKLGNLYRGLKAQRLADLSLHAGQDVVLWVLAQQPEGMTVSELADRLGVRRPTATRSLARLEGRELFTREQVPGDRRRVRIVLTEHARRLVPAIEEVWASLAADLAGSMSPRQQDAWVRTLEGAAERMRSLVDESVLTEE